MSNLDTEGYPVEAKSSSELTDQNSFPTNPKAQAKPKPLSPSTPQTSPTAHLLFSPLSNPITQITATLSRTPLTLRNRLHSISTDAAFITSVASELQLPVIANERCGSWYVPPDLKAGSAYFKSTDGHWGEWGVSLRRLNLGVLGVAGGGCEGREGGGREGKGRGCVVVDSTRRGKHLPDALSKTIPIWIAVFNRLLFPEDHASHELQYLSSLVSPSEAAQISERLPRCAADIEKLDLPLDDLRRQVRTPLRPFWIARSLGLYPPSLEERQQWEDQCKPLYLCMASLHHEAGDVEEGYCQGAGDDVENWGKGLTPEIFWRHKKAFLEAREDELRELIEDLVGEERQNKASGEQAETCKKIDRAPWLEIGSLEAADSTDASGLTICLGVNLEGADTKERSQRVRKFDCREGKLGSKDLRKLLPNILCAVENHTSGCRQLRVCCPCGKDLAVGVALAILCRRSDNDGHFIEQSLIHVDKVMIRKNLSWITTSMPNANPSRATLNAVNEFLMGSKP